MKNNIAVLVLISALLGGCENGELVMTPEARAAEKSTVQKRGGSCRDVQRVYGVGCEDAETI